MYTAPACVFWLAIGSMIFEVQRMLAANAFAKIVASPVLYGSAAAMGFMVNATAYLTIQLAGSLTVKVLGTVKNAVVVWLGVLLWAEPVTMLQLGGYGASIVGFAMYNWHKMNAPVRATKVGCVCGVDKAPRRHRILGKTQPAMKRRRCWTRRRSPAERAPLPGGVHDGCPARAWTIFFSF